MSHGIVSREAIQTGDRVYCIEDRAVGIVTDVDDRVLEVTAFNSARYRIPLAEVFTSTNHSVTLQFAFSGLERFASGT